MEDSVAADMNTWDAFHCRKSSTTAVTLMKNPAEPGKRDADRHGESSEKEKPSCARIQGFSSLSNASNSDGGKLRRCLVTVHGRTRMCIQEGGTGHLGQVGARTLVLSLEQGDLCTWEALAGWQGDGVRWHCGGPRSQEIMPTSPSEGTTTGTFLQLSPFLNSFGMECFKFSSRRRGGCPLLPRNERRLCYGLCYTAKECPLCGH